MTSKQSYASRLELNKQNKLAAGLVSEKLPGVARIVIHMTYYQKGENPVLMLRTVNFSSASHAYFHMECMIKDCLDGGYELSPVIKKMVKERKKTTKGRLVCRGKNKDLPSDHGSIDYEIAIEYGKKR